MTIGMIAARCGGEGPRTGLARRAVEASLRVPLFAKILVANAAITTLAFGLGGLGPQVADWLTPQWDALGAALVLVAVGVALGAAVNAAILRVALAPLRELERAAERIEHGRLGARASLSSLADRDMMRLVRAFNGALDRQESYGRCLRELAFRTTRSEEETCRRMAVELREDAGQRLASLLLRLRAVEANGGEPEATRELVEDARREISGALEILRRYAGGRAERLVADLGLAGAIEWQARRVGSAYALEITVDIDRVDTELSEDARLVLFQIVQEALENAGRHAAARHVSVRIWCEGDRVVAAIVDDGLGFRPGQATDGCGLGLVGMEERAAAVEGRVDVTSAPARGTRVRADIPARAAGRTAAT